MTVRTTCKNCGRRLKGSDSLLGKTVPCPNCGEPIHIVGERDTGAGGQDEPAAPVAARSPRFSPQRRKSVWEVEAPERPSEEQHPPLGVERPPAEEPIERLIRTHGAGDADMRARERSNKDVCEDLKMDLYRRVLERRDELGLRFRMELGEPYDYWMSMRFFEALGTELLHERSIRVTIDEDEHTYDVQYESNARPVTPQLGLKTISEEDIEAWLTFLVALKKPKEKKGNLGERLRRFMKKGLGVLTVPLGCVVVILALALLPLWIVLGVVWFALSGRIRRTYTIARQVPSQVPKSYRPMSYWHTLVPGIGEHEQGVRAGLKSGLEGLDLPDTAVAEKELTQWGGYTLEEKRTWLTVSSRRAVVLVGVWGYGADLYVSWDAYLNTSFWDRRPVKTIWPVKKLARATGSWLRALASRVQVLDYEAIATPMTEYDYADVSALSDAVHKVVLETVEVLQKRFRIERELDRTPVHVPRTGAEGRPGVAESAERPTSGLKSLLSGLRRKR